MRPLHAVLAATALATAACQPRAETGLTEADRAAIQSGEDNWVRLTLAKDWPAAVAAYWSDDAVVLPPNAPSAAGKDAILAWISTFPPFSAFSMQQVSVDGRDDLAYVRGTYTLRVTPPGATAPIDDHGKHITIWKRQADGSWKAILATFSSDLPLPTTQSAPPN